MSEETLICRVEIPKGSRNKYEYDEDLQAIKLDRFVSASVVYPTDYGYVPETLAPDGDPLDVLVCVSEPTFPGCVVPARAIGLFHMSDEKGPDDHVVCVPVDDPGWNWVQGIDDLPNQLRAEIGHFFAVYKDLDEGRYSEVGGWGGIDEAHACIDEARKRHREAAGAPS
jgi:inorganic pyrophosphatase